VKVNWSRVILGGLIAGIIINAVEMTFHGLRIGGDWWFFQALIHSPVQSAGDILSYVGMYTLKGLVAVWLYAVARPRFGPGPRTALIIGFAYWVIGYLIPVVSFEPLMLEAYATQMLRMPGLVALLELVLGTLGGAWFYTERPE
jgi:hypothetical protein